MKPMKLGVDTYDMLDEKHNSPKIMAGLQSLSHSSLEDKGQQKIIGF
jgi:hypothetical protein